VVSAASSVVDGTVVVGAAVEDETVVDGGILEVPGAAPFLGSPHPASVIDAHGGGDDRLAVHFNLPAPTGVPARTALTTTRIAWPGLGGGRLLRVSMSWSASAGVR
jgi:hypothetical protein